MGSSSFSLSHGRNTTVELVVTRWHHCLHKIPRDPFYYNTGRHCQILTDGLESFESSQHCQGENHHLFSVDFSFAYGSPDVTRNISGTLNGKSSCCKCKFYAFVRHFAPVSSASPQYLAKYGTQDPQDTMRAG